MYPSILLLQKRELHQLRGKLKNIVDKREIVFRERRLLTDRVDSIVKNIGEEIEARKLVSGDEVDAVAQNTLSTLITVQNTGYGIHATSFK